MSCRFRELRPHAQADLLEPITTSSSRLIKQNGASMAPSSISAKAGDKWLGVPACVGSQIKGPCSRIDLMKQHAGIDVQAMYRPALRRKPSLEHGNVPEGAEACHKGGVPFGIGLGETSDSVDTVGAFFLAFGAESWTPRATSSSRTNNVRAGARILQETDGVPAADAPAWTMVPTTVLDLRQGRADHESAERNGR